MSKEGRQVLVIKENENSSQEAIPLKNITLLAKKCQQKLENIYNTEGNVMTTHGVVGSWKYCPNCKPKATATQKKGDPLL